MGLTLYFHPLASFCHKVLIALYENELPFDRRVVDLTDPASRADLLAHWPTGKMPVLRDDRRGCSVAESSIIIEYLQQHWPGPVALLPADGDAALQARLWDRLFDLHIGVPMQKIVTDRIRPEGQTDPTGVADAHAALQSAYDLVDRQLDGRAWATGDAFTLADCAAAPALFFATIVAPPAPHQIRFARYLERLLARPSVARVIHEAQPFFSLFPYRDAMPARFLQP